MKEILQSSIVWLRCSALAVNMASINIAGTELKVKDYCCIEAGNYFEPLFDAEYLKKRRLKLWLYVNVTDRCNAGCLFCVSAALPTNMNIVNPQQFRKVLEVVAPHIYGISFTGGEPMLYPELLDELVHITEEIVPSDAEIDLVTNGTWLARLSELKSIDRITSVHISRHSSDTVVNNAIMRQIGPEEKEIKQFIQSLNDPGKVVLNCVLQKGGVSTMDDVAAYLEFAINAGVQNSSFITMFKANSHCEANYISAFEFPFVSDNQVISWNRLHPDNRFSVWNRHSDYEFCHCLSGSYKNKEGHTRFYFRCPGTGSSPDYCRQLVYTADNHLQDGFGKNRTVIL